MENKIKRFLSLAVAIIMVIGMLPGNVFASGTADAASVNVPYVESPAMGTLPSDAASHTCGDVTMHFYWYEDNFGAWLEFWATNSGSEAVNVGVSVDSDVGYLSPTSVAADASASIGALLNSPNLSIASGAQHTAVVTIGDAEYHFNLTLSSSTATEGGEPTDAVAEVASEAELVTALANGGEIKLTADITVDTAITALDDTVIDLNGKTLYVNVENSYYNNVTIKNGNIVLGKDDVHVCDGYFLVNAGKTLVLNGVKMTSSDEGIKGYAVFHLKTGANLDLISSDLNISDNEYTAGYVVYASESTATVDITGTTLVGKNVNGIVHATTVIDGSNITIEAVEHGINRSGVTINDSTVTISGGTGRGITAQHGDLNITGNSVVTISEMGEATIELRNDKNLTVADTATVTVDAAVNNTTSGTITGTVTVKEPAAGTITGGMVNIENPDEYFITTEINGLNATESVVIKLYSGETHIATTTLKKTEYFTTSPLSVKIIITGESSTWDTVWEEGKLSADYVPDKVVLYVDGTEMNSGVIQMIKTGTETAIDWADVVPATVTGSMTPAYASDKDGNTNRIWGEATTNASESFVVKLYAGETLLATTTLQEAAAILAANDTLTYGFYYSPEDEYWNTVWENGQPNADTQPTKVVLIADGEKVAENVVKMGAPDDLHTVVWKDLEIFAHKLAGSGTEADPYLIENLEDLILFRDQVDTQAADGSTQFAGKYFKLTADIDLAGINWNPIGSMTGDHGSFKGVFDGNGKTISNLTISGFAENGAGLFARTAGDAEIKNLTLHNVSISSTSNYVGAVVGNAYASTKITNVHVTGDVQISGRGYIGGIAGHGYVVMDNVSVKANEGSVISSSFWCAGGILGYGGEGVTNITNASVENLTIQSAAGGLGSIVGMAEDNNGTQPISGSNLSAKNIVIKTYDGGYSVETYGEYALGYLYGGNPTSILTGTLVAENVTFECSTGNTEPAVSDAVAKIGNNVYFDLASAFAAAQDGDTVTILRAGTYALSTSGKDITITGAVDGVVFDNIGAKNMGGANVTFNNVTFDYLPNTNYTGLQHSGNLVYNNCIINGTVFLYGASETFNSCTFNVEGDAYNVWTYGAKAVAFNNCTFNSDGKSVLVYNEGAGATDLTVTKCTFIASAPVDGDGVGKGKAAIEIDTSLMPEGTKIVIDGETTATKFSDNTLSGSSLWHDKKDLTNLTVTVDGELVWPLQPTATIGHGLQTIVTPSKPREAVTFTVEDVYAENELKVELWSNGTLIATTTLRQADRDDANATFYPAEGDRTVNIVVSGAEAGSWDTTWHVAPSVDYIPDTIKVYVDGSTEPVDTYTAEGGVFLNETEKAEYLGLDGVYKSIIATDENGNVGYYTNLDDLFNDYDLRGVITVQLLDNVVAENVVKTNSLRTYNFVTSVEGGVTMDLKYEDNWNYFRYVNIGENITVNAKYLVFSYETEIAGTINAYYPYISGADVTVTETGVLNSGEGDGLQIKSGATLTVYGTVTAGTVNVWSGDSKLIVSGENAKLTASWIDIWDGTPSVTIENGATLKVDAIKASRGGSITIDGATLDTASLELGHNGESTGTLTVTNNGTVTGETKLTAVGSTVTGPEDMNVTTTVADHKVVYADGVYSVVAKTYVATVTDGEGTVTKYESINEALTAAQAGDTVTILAGEYTGDVSVNKAITVVGETDENGNNLVTINGKLNLTADNAVAKNLTVKSSGNGLYINAADVLIEGCNISGSNGVRYCYTSGTVTFKNSKITGNTYGIHFDGNSNGNIVIEGCEITGWTSFASTIDHVTITDTEFKDGNYNLLRFYQNATLTNVTFPSGDYTDYAGSGMRIDVGNGGGGMDGVTVTMNNCKTADGTDLVGAIDPETAAKTDYIVDGVLLVVEASVTDAEGNTEYYWTLEEAVAAAESGDTVTLLTHATGAGVVFENGDNVIIDLNGYTYTLDKSVGSSAQYGTVGFYLWSGSTVTIKNGTINMVADEMGDDVTFFKMFHTYGDLTLTDVTLDCANGVAYNGSTDVGFIAVESDNGTVTINGSTSIVNAQLSPETWTVTAYKNGKITINTTGTIEGVVASYGSNASVEIKNGTFTESNDSYDLLTSISAGSISVTGGTFSEDVNADCAEGYYAIANGDGTWTVSDDYVEWIKAELLAGRSVTLEKDIVVDGSYIDSISAPTNSNGVYFNPGIFNVVGDVDVTFDLNGHTITYNGHADYACGVNDKFKGNSCNIAHGLFLANNGANLTIKGEGNVIVNGMASGVYPCSPNSVITIEGGTWTNNGCATCDGTNLFLYASHGGELYIKGGHFEQVLDSNGDSYLIVEHGGEFKNAVIDYSLTKIVVSGGTFVGMNPEEAVFIDQGNGQAFSKTNVVAEDYVAVAVEGATNTWTVVENKYVAQNTTTEVKYESVSEALAAAQSGQTVVLLTEATENYVLVTPGVTLDLNGKTLTATYATTFGNSFIVDNSADNTGLLKIAKDAVVLNKSNTQLPVWTGEGYIFDDVQIVDNRSGMGITWNATDDVATLKFVPFFGDKLADPINSYLMNGASDNEVSIIVRLTWTTDNGTAYQNFVYNDTQVGTVVAADGNKAFILNLNGYLALEDLTISAMILSETGVEISGTVYEAN